MYKAAYCSMNLLWYIFQPILNHFFLLLWRWIWHFHWLTYTGRVPHGGEAVFQWENTHMLTMDTSALGRTSFSHWLLSSCPLSVEYSCGCYHWWSRHLTILMSFLSNPPCSSQMKFPSVSWYGDGRKSDHTLKKTKDGRKNKVEWSKCHSQIHVTNRDVVFPPGME